MAFNIRGLAYRRIDCPQLESFLFLLQKARPAIHYEDSFLALVLFFLQRFGIRYRCGEALHEKQKMKKVL